MHVSMIISVPAIKLINNHNVIVMYWFKLQNIDVLLLDLFLYVLIQVRS